MSKMGITTIKNGNRVNYEIFNSIDELCRTIKDRPYRREIGYEDTVDKDMSIGWEGVNSYAEAEKMLLHGWSEKVGELKQKVSKAVHSGERKRVVQEQAVAGFMPIVPLALLGVPNSMINSTMRPVKSKIINVFYNFGYLCDIQAQDVLKVGQEIVEAVVSLEKQGFRVRIYAGDARVGNASGDGMNRATASMDFMAVKIKDEAQPLDLQKIMFPLMHPAMLRAICFAWYERNPNSKKRSGYGGTLNQSLGAKRCGEMIKEMFGEASVFLSGEQIIRNHVDVKQQLQSEADAVTLNKKQGRK